LNLSSVSLAEIPIASTCAFHGVDVAAELYMRRRATRCLLTRSVGRIAVSSHFRDLSLHRPPDLSIRVHSLLPGFPFEVPSPYLPITLRQSVLPGFLPSSRRHKGVHFCKGVPAPATFRPQVFATSRRLPPPFAVRACFIPLPRPGFSRSGVCPRFAGAAARRRDLTPVPLELARSPVFVRSFLTGHFPTATFKPVDFEALLRDPVRIVSWLFKPAPDRSPLRFLLLQVCATSP